MIRVANLVESVNQGVLVVGFECNTEVYGGSLGRVTLAFPVLWNGVPCMLHLHVIPARSNRRGKGERERGKNGERR